METEGLAVPDVQPIDNRVAVLILQHPQEQDKELGTAQLVTRLLKNSVLKVGLSWPSLSKALGREADPKRWAVLHLGSVKAKDFPPNESVAVFDKKGQPLPDQKSALAGIDGIVVLDGSWAQAKTLWWRNAWVLKARRIALRPQRRSLYGDLRREPRREGLSTLESVAVLLARLERKPEIETAMLDAFGTALSLYREHRMASATMRT
jgi:DTW domain-containing protein YfiP